MSETVTGPTRPGLIRTPGHYSVYDRQTGLIEYSVLLQDSDRLQMLVGEGKSCIVGDYDGLCQRVDVETGQVVDYQPSRPSQAHEWDAVTKRWVYVKTDADIAAEVRAKRDALFAVGDGVMLRAIRLGEPVPQAWADYQQQLADVPEQPGFPRNVVWPSVPE
jgi:hypothetical protein